MSPAAGRVRYLVRYLKLTLFIFLTLLMLWSSLLPMDVTGNNPSFLGYLEPGLQNFLHIPAFALFAFLALDLTGSFFILTRPRILAVILFVFGFGVLMEVIQISVPGRYASFLDLFLNLLGIVAGLAVYKKKRNTTWSLF